MKTAYQELLAWIEQNATRFTTESYSDEDIAKLAATCGFDQSVVSQWKSHRAFQKVSLI